MSYWANSYWANSYWSSGYWTQLLSDIAEVFRATGSLSAVVEDTALLLIDACEEALIKVLISDQVDVFTAIASEPDALLSIRDVAELIKGLASQAVVSDKIVDEYDELEKLK